MPSPEPPTESSTLQSLYNFVKPVNVPSQSPLSYFKNWAGTYECRPLAIFEPTNQRQFQAIFQIAQLERKTVRIVGVGHSPSDIACTDGFMIRMAKYNKVLKINTDEKFVIAQGGITLHDLNACLERHNLAISSLGSISDQTLAGAISTATHGSGINYAVLSAHVVTLTMLLANGKIVCCTRTENQDLFMASLCGLGATGIILSVQLQVESAFRLKDVQKTVPFEDVVGNLDILVNSSEHVRFWWFPVSDMIRCSYANRTSELKCPATASWWRSTVIEFHFIQILLFLARYFVFLNKWTAKFACWLGSSPTSIVDDSYRIFNIDCLYSQHTTEWAIPYEHTEVCLRQLRVWLRYEYNHPEGLRPHFPIEIRFSSGDDIWLSPSYGRPTCWIGIIQYRPYGFEVPYERLFNKFNAIMACNKGRPHWAKSHHLGPDTLQVLYPHFNDFVNVKVHEDPTGMFHNEYVRRHIIGSSNVREKTVC
ncbi:D-arabinono-1,4-lactone oxidase-domain-containing protein [Cyathus striatus]|nr:D-arabinono-1,4-lactone oxidase-domain-containing protein [Cyathus striatus]